MKIIDKRNEVEKKTFRDIKCGEVFCGWEKGIAYMKARVLYDCDGMSINAFALEDGDPVYFKDNAKAIPLNCECIITNK